jgi:hypothetical protein
MSKKFWRSGMIDRRVVAEKEWHEHINEIKMAMIESYRERYVVKHGNNKLYYFNLADDYDEVRKGDNVTLDFGENIIAAPRERLKDSMFNAYSRWLRNRGSYDSDLKFEKQTFGEVEDENNTRDI